jgi:predicted RecB family nuclease
MGKELRSGTKNATASITRYDDYHRTLNGEKLELGETADEIREDILQYNRYDCYSMLKLRNWLEEIASSQGGSN